MRPPLDETYWSNLNHDTSLAMTSAGNDRAAWAIAARKARAVLRAYSTSFFLVTRFLPFEKRAQVEIVYAAVRYPDEVVDTFPLTSVERLERLREWENAYERALGVSSIRQAIDERIPCFLAAFTRVVRDRGIPAEHYRAFLGAMRMDVEPRPFPTLDDLIESYIYGSATVVGYFLAYVYGPKAPDALGRALAAARSLAIGLQLTNFLRDVGEDRHRGRLYLPLDFLRDEGISAIDLQHRDRLTSLNRVLCRLSAVAESHYAQAEMDLEAFAPDSRTAIGACIRVYRNLNQRIGRSAEGVFHRETVPMRTKFQALPASKYWRIPLAYTGVL